MRGASCLRAGKFLAGRRAGLSESERLWLEEHVQGCAPCRDDARALAALTAIADDAAEASVGERGLARAVQVALRENGARTAAPVARPVRRIVLSFAGAALAAGAVALAWAAWPSSPSSLSSRPSAVAVAEPRVVPAGEPVKLAHAEVVLAAGGAAEWDAGRTTVHLTRGRVAVHVDRAPHKPFRVATDRFVVEVTGTRFEVAADAVEVSEGTVRVLALDGAPLVEKLAAGGRWQLRESAAAAAPVEPVAPVAPPPTPAPSPPPPAPNATASRPAVGPLLDDARRGLARGHTDDARRLVGRALDASPSRAQRAEADTLLAEAALVDGDTSGAQERYTRVAERFTDLPAGENALFAAAGLAARAHRDDDARRLADRYLERYPAGRFAPDVRELRSRLPR